MKNMNMSDRRTVHRVCPFCEATCGLAIEVKDNSIVSVRGDKEDPFSRGFICPKAYELKELHHDPDRLRQPVRHTANGWEEISWDEAYKEVTSRLLAIREQYGNNAIGMYAGNPIVHDLAFLYLPLLIRALANRSAFNSEAIDTLPKIIQTGLMFGGPFPSGFPVKNLAASCEAFTKTTLTATAACVTVCSPALAPVAECTSHSLAQCPVALRSPRNTRLPKTPPRAAP